MTIGTVAALIVMGIVCGSFWHQLPDSPWWNRLAFGLPALQHGRWWTPATGSLLAENVFEYVPILLIFGAVLALCERRLGTARTAVIAVAGQLFGVLGTAGLLAVLKSSGWAWAASRSHDLDVGTSCALLTLLVVYGFTLRAPWRSRLIVVVFAAVLSFLLVLLLRARRPRRTMARYQVGETIKAHGGGNLSWMATWPANEYFVPVGQAGALAYQVHSNTALALGDPLGPAGNSSETLRQFAAHCEKQGYLPCLFSASDRSLTAVNDLGWQSVQIAEDTIIDLPRLEFKGKSWQSIRTALNRAARSDVSFRMVRLRDEPFRVVAQVRSMCEEWVSGKGLPEMGLTLGGVDEALDPDVRVGLAASADGTVHGVTSWLPVYRGDSAVRGWTLDVMRRDAGEFRPVMEFMIASACQTFRDEGAEFVSLSGAPLACSEPDAALSGIDTLLDLVGRLLEPFYGFRSLHRFKSRNSCASSWNAGTCGCPGRPWCRAMLRPRCSPVAVCSRCCPISSGPSTLTDRGSPTVRPACAGRTSRKWATTGTRPSSKCSATGVWATTSRLSNCPPCGHCSPSDSGLIRPGSSSPASPAMPTMTSRRM